MLRGLSSQDFKEFLLYFTLSHSLLPYLVIFEPVRRSVFFADLARQLGDDRLNQGILFGVHSRCHVMSYDMSSNLQTLALITHYQLSRSD